MIHTLDLNFMGIAGAIAAYLLPHKNGVVLIECGPGSTIPGLKASLGALGYTEKDVTDVFLTHIHLDHGGAAGWMARQGACIHVHPVGAPHMLNPEKLLSSAARIYGSMMDTLWGEFLPVPVDKLVILQDKEEVEIEGIHLRAIDTPGHATHHHAYLVEKTCFSGDIGGVRLQGTRHLRIPMPPPEFNLESWRASVGKLRMEYKKGSFERIAPTHFGLHDDPDVHLASLKRGLDEVEAWMEKMMPSDPSLELINESFLEWVRKKAVADGIEPSLVNAYEAANPSWMSAAGMQRYWRKNRKA
jgi:glyoxylase-like metal-dependent hydrolase (beta-lactamase superfamily II)